MYKLFVHRDRCCYASTCTFAKYNFVCLFYIHLLLLSLQSDVTIMMKKKMNNYYLLFQFKDEFSEEFNKEEEGQTVPGKQGTAKSQQAKTSSARHTSVNDGSSSSHVKSHTSQSRPVVKAKTASTTSHIRPIFTDINQSRPLSRPGSIKSRLGALVPRAVTSPMKRPSSSQQDRKVYVLTIDV